MSETATEKLKRMLAWDTTPALTETDVSALLDQSSMADANGTPPGGTDWEATYDLNAAAAAGLCCQTIAFDADK
jgi:acyl-CoA-binding protein